MLYTVCKLYCPRRRDQEDLGRNLDSWRHYRENILKSIVWRQYLFCNFDSETCEIANSMMIKDLQVLKY